MSAPNVGQFIDLLISIPAKGQNGLSNKLFPQTMMQITKLFSRSATVRVYTNSLPLHQAKDSYPDAREIQGAYQIKVTTTALALLLTSRHTELEKLHVQGHLIKSGVGITTRPKAKSAPDQWIMLPLPTKIVALLADALIEIQEQVLAGDDKKKDHEFLSSVSAAASGKPTYEHLEAIAKVFNEDQEDQYEDDLLSVADPLKQIILAIYLKDFFFANLYQSDRQLFDNIFQSLTQAQRKAIQMALQR